MGWGIFGGILFIAMGLFMFFKPELIWKLTEQWKSYRADCPSDIYTISTKIGGLVFLAVGIIVLILVFCLE